ncbi:MAG: diaminopimelate epimerase [Bacteroidetes bacterium GWF2_33_16]|nr:MAG: diaminopimelate epimerase [Bacteroidetes bacterium GWE2_32_14]OFY03176.1 MAG: diaminopimelate epimerase [Bacteroidetes bacterium GWF2_33_16]
MKIPFYKYHGTGNDFIIIDNRSLLINLSTDQIRLLCDRHFGIGADGLMFIEKNTSFAFTMKYYNSDGKESTMCGNGGRCLTAFAKELGLVTEKVQFNAIDGIHEAIINENDTISLKMTDVSDFKIIGNNYLINTGSPHYVIFESEVNKIDVYKKGAEIRYSSDFEPSGVNVNFVEIINDELFVRTYERGVGNETLSCGTGVTASAICASIKMNTDKSSWDIKTLGGNLNVRFKKAGDQSFTDIWLTGPATFVFKGEIDI